MNITETPPEHVTVCGRRVPINTDFRAGVRFEMMINDGVTDPDRLLAVWFDGKIRNKSGYLAAAVDFFACGMGGGGAGDAHTERVYDFRCDGGAIIASFMSAYGIDLTSAHMHWWLFRELLIHLPPDSAFKRIVAIRAASGDAVGGEAAKRIRRLQKLYAIDFAPRETLDARNERWMRHVAESFGRIRNEREVK